MLLLVCNTCDGAEAPHPPPPPPAPRARSIHPHCAGCIELLLGFQMDAALLQVDCKTLYQCAGWMGGRRGVVSRQCKCLYENHQKRALSRTGESLCVCVCVCVGWRGGRGRGGGGGAPQERLATALSCMLMACKTSERGERFPSCVRMDPQVMCSCSYISICLPYMQACQTPDANLLNKTSSTCSMSV